MRPYRGFSLLRGRWTGGEGGLHYFFQLLHAVQHARLLGHRHLLDGFNDSLQGTVSLAEQRGGVAGGGGGGGGGRSIPKDGYEGGLYGWSEGRHDTRHCNQTGGKGGKREVTVTEINEGLRVLPGDVNVPSKIKFQKPLENVLYKVWSYYGRKIPV